MTFKEELILKIIENGILAALILLIGYWINASLIKYKNNQEKILELEKQKINLNNELQKSAIEKKLALLQKKMDDFFYPIYMRLQKDNVTWKLVPRLQKNAENLPPETNDMIENNFIIKNHEEIISIIENNFHLIEEDFELADAILLYIRHVTVYKTIRAIDTFKEMTPKDFNEPFPVNFFELVNDRLTSIRKEYNELLKAFLEKENSN